MVCFSTNGVSTTYLLLEQLWLSSLWETFLLTGEPWSYTQRFDREPNNRGDEGYLEITPRDQSWNDIPTRGADNHAIQYLFERGYYTDPNNSDSDGDEFNDRVEYEAGALPNDPNSRPVPKLLSQP